MEVLSLMNGLLRYSAVLIMALPVAVIATCDINILTGRDGGWDGTILLWPVMLAIFLLIWAGVVFWSSRGHSLRQALARVCQVLSLVGLLTPLPGLVQCIAAGNVQDPIFPVWTMFLLGVLVGVPIYVIGRVGHSILKSEFRSGHAL